MRIEQIRRQVFEHHTVAVAHDDAVFDGSAEFADIAGPVVFHHRWQGVLAEGLEGFAIGFGQFFEKMVGQHGDVTLARTQRRKLDGDDAETPVEIFAKFAFLDHLCEVAVRGGNDADIDLDRLATADTFDGLLAESAEQFDLRAGVDLADFIEEQRATIRLLEAADTELLSAGE